MPSYNDIPVIYCKNCGSLAIKEAHGFDFCNNCGSINYTGEMVIEEYVNLYPPEK